MIVALVFCSNELRLRFGHGIYARFETDAARLGPEDLSIGAHGQMAMSVLSGRVTRAGFRGCHVNIETQSLTVAEQRDILTYFKKLYIEHCPESFMVPGEIKFPKIKVVDNLTTRDLVAAYMLYRKVEMGELTLVTETPQTTVLVDTILEVAEDSLGHWAEACVDPADQKHFLYTTYPLLNQKIQRSS